MLAESPMRPSTPKASAASWPPLLHRLLPGGANQFPGGYTPAVDHRLFTAHPVTRPSTPKASAASWPPLLHRLLPGGANQFPGGYTPAVDHRLFTAHPVTR